jgi:hypothetical protein
MSEFYSNFVLFLDQTNRFGKKNLDDFQFVWQMIDCRTHPALQVLGKVPDRLSQAVWDGKQHLKKQKFQCFDTFEGRKLASLKVNSLENKSMD